MRRELREMGFGHEDLAAIHGFESFARRQGLDPRPVLAWVAENQSRFETYPQFAQAFEGFASQAGIDAGSAELVLGWMDNVGTTGELGLSEREELQLHAEEIRAYRQEFPHESEQNRQLQATELELIGELSALDKKPQAPAAVASNEAAPSSAGRLDEIRAMRRDNPDLYERNASAFEREEIALLSGGQHEAPAPAGDADLRELARNDPDGFDRLESAGFASAPAVPAAAPAPAAAAPAQQGAE